MNKEPVDIKKQSQYVYIPGLDLYAASKVGKLPQYVMIVLGIGLPVFGVMIYFFPISLMHVVIPEIAILPVAIHFMKKWSREWNEQFSENQFSDELK
ncbi:hypothetical protein BD31_I1504 [Candidatus Nitrosopumilus salaria BD31]|uniref:Uncharacterized protein n=1 Tax=Candidatus Nitrosopumilus salarius BD31 TaxID=859350 RepID=I3D3M7_9ARCH|nr:hypothetical protein [Candidatus Nitrosopumilus salaria]EIJ66320.1 hypothetical protein BD31_I1504 [Candidatus Nitrosopumilus salaria BD31]